MKPVGGKQWFTAAELADLALPGLAKSKRKVNERAEAERWALKVDAVGMPLSRPREARGGGLEYHIDVLPAAARLELSRRGIALVADEAPELPSAADMASRWDWFERQSEKVKVEARRRAEIVDAVERHARLGLSRSTAVASAAAEHGVSQATLWNWLKLLKGTDPNDRLVHLAPQRSGGGAEAEIDAGAWLFLKSDYLRPEKPTFSSCYWRLKRDYCEPRGIAIPHERTLRRKLEREVDGRLIMAKRNGAEALREMLPPQQRTVEGHYALDLVNIDGHKVDVFVRFPSGRVGRPIIVAVQDIYSRKILSWRLGESENALLTRLAFADVFDKFGIPKRCLLDNGRAFASKWITGGSKSRFRFKIREEEPTGLLTQLGIEIHWAKPYSGRSKPIERAFRDFCDAIAKHPAFAGAYTGNKPDAKPENYGERAIDLPDFMKVFARGVAAHNEKPGRRTEMAAGRSFDEVFAASYAVSPIGKASPEQMRLALLTADEVTTDRKSGFISLYGNRYWSPELSEIAGNRVTVRFDPDDLTKALHVYDRAGRFLASAPLLEATGFLDAASAKQRAKQEADHRKAARRAAELENLLSAEQLAALLPDSFDELDLPEPSVIRPVRRRGNTAAALKHASQTQLTQPQEASKPAAIDRIAAFAERHLRAVD